MISTAGIVKSFGDKRVLDGINLDIHEGEIFGLLGPSGAGKTTLIRILIGSLNADEGAVTVLGKSVKSLTGEDKKKFGIMMEDFGIYEKLNCFDNLKVFARIYGIPDSEIVKILEEVGLKEAAKTKASNLSKGMRERLKIARAFLTRPKIIFLDEPTSGLDPQTAREIHEMIIRRKNAGCVIFLTTHNMAEAEKLCDRLALLNEGKIVEQGNPKEVCLRFNHQKCIQVVLKDGTQLEYSMNGENSECAAQEIAELIRSQEIRTIHSQEPNLETVFMELTGRRFEA